MKSVVMEQTERQADPGQTAQLIEVLRALESSYTNLLGLLRVRKERVRRGDLKGLYDCVQDERRLLCAIRKADREREMVMNGLRSTGANGGAYGDGTLDAVVSGTAEPMSTELCSVREQLRLRVEEVHAEYAVIKQVGEALSSHVANLVQRLQMFGTNAVLYGRNGQVGGRQPILSGVDIRT